MEQSLDPVANPTPHARQPFTKKAKAGRYPKSPESVMRPDYRCTKTNSIFSFNNNNKL